MTMPNAIILGGINPHRRRHSSHHLVEHNGYTEALFATPVRQLVSHLNPIIQHKNNDTLRVMDIVDFLGWEEAATTFPEIARLTDRLRRGIPETLYQDALTDAVLTQCNVRQKYVFPDVHNLGEFQSIQNWFGASAVYSLFLHPPGGPVVTEVTSEEISHMKFDDAVVNMPGYFNDTFTAHPQPELFDQALHEHITGLRPAAFGWSRHAS